MTQKKEVIKRLSRQALTEEAMSKVKPDVAINNLKKREGGQSRFADRKKIACPVISI